MDFPPSAWLLWILAAVVAGALEITLPGFVMLWFSVGALAASLAAAQDFPTRPIRLVIPQAPGSGADAVGRMMADFMTKDLKQSVVVDNKPGANGIIASQLVQKEPAEGQRQVDIVMLTHRAIERDVDRAMQKIERLRTVLGSIVRLRLEALL